MRRDDLHVIFDVGGHSQCLVHLGRPQAAADEAEGRHVDVEIRSRFRASDGEARPIGVRAGPGVREEERTGGEDVLEHAQVLLVLPRRAVVDERHEVVRTRPALEDDQVVARAGCTVDQARDDGIDIVVGRRIVDEERRRRDRSVPMDLRPVEVVVARSDLALPDDVPLLRRGGSRAVRLRDRRARVQSSGVVDEDRARPEQRAVRQDEPAMDVVVGGAGDALPHHAVIRRRRVVGIAPDVGPELVPCLGAVDRERGRHPEGGRADRTPADDARAARREADLGDDQELVRRSVARVLGSGPVRGRDVHVAAEDGGARRAQELTEDVVVRRADHLLESDQIAIGAGRVGDIGRDLVRGRAVDHKRGDHRIDRQREAGRSERGSRHVDLDDIPSEPGLQRRARAARIDRDRAAVAHRAALVRKLEPRIALARREVALGRDAQHEITACRKTVEDELLFDGPGREVVEFGHDAAVEDDPVAGPSR